MKTQHLIIAILILPFLFGCKNNSQDCVGKFPKDNDISTLLENPYEFCDKGDIITVTSSVYEDIGLLPVRKWQYAKGVYSNSVNNYCSFSHPIVLLGTTKVRIEFEGEHGIDTFLLNSYSCSYNGKARDLNSKNWDANTSQSPIKH